MSASVGKELGVSLDRGVGDVGLLCEEGGFIALVSVSNDFLLVVVKRQHSALFLLAKGFEGAAAAVDLAGKDGHQGVILVGHGAISNTLEC